MLAFVVVAIVLIVGLFAANVGGWRERCCVRALRFVLSRYCH